MTGIAILGNGTVGSGVEELINKNIKKIKDRTGEEIRIAKILVRDINKHLGQSDASLLTDKIEELFNEDIDIVVEVMGGINPAYEYIKKFLNMKKHVVTANKDLIAKHGEELLSLANKNQVKLHFEASVGGGIPILKPLSECLAGNEIRCVKGILNGTTNFILSKMYNENMGYDKALKIAQELGFAEANPESDVMGYDAARKLSILSTIAYGKKVDWQEIKTIGITEIDETDIQCAKEANCNIKLLAMSSKDDKGIYAAVRPVLVSRGSQIAKVEDEFNGISVEGDAVGDMFFYGKGAGKLPTASAVFGDIVDIIENKGRKMLFPVREKAEVYGLWKQKSEWMLRIKCKNRVETMCALGELFSKCCFSNAKGKDGDEVVAFVESESEEILDSMLNKLNNQNSILDVKKFIKLDN
ncbi:homoserine dehydrogenase [Clostridium thermopalmarium]|uniref:Homoserine dehydrogenase n=1 Tax=Clostridium thermopalmarium DSM 5974 TaxID=1121340 RepID=A0A2T0AJQ2_9CLOT|nr:homoserine dehydrogenase [Clostridium thermopalmarium]PRR68573.1 Homoserine dehydrogenase [Clostridium thermopalmarium DSM 5974]PVZ15816.1 homoserine dehydrogenase [Clostridium thermopalmarium DSM 5974]